MGEETKGTSMVMKVIDSNVFIDHLREYPPAMNFFQEISSRDTADILFSALTETELIAGKSCENIEARLRVLHMLNSLTKINVDNPIALLAGDICRKYNLKLPDAVIAATALFHKAELLTKNVSDFQKIESLVIKEPY